jgi:hypothetical protein
MSFSFLMAASKKGKRLPPSRTVFRCMLSQLESASDRKWMIRDCLSWLEDKEMPATRLSARHFIAEEIARRRLGAVVFFKARKNQQKTLTLFSSFDLFPPSPPLPPQPQQHSQDRFYELSNPERENLCLYGNPDATWEVDLPAEEVPPELPEPALGINFARNGMARADWLALVAVHSDTWLLAVAFYNGARLNKEGRERLFDMINELPTCYEVVSGKAADVGDGGGGGGNGAGAGGAQANAAGRGGGGGGRGGGGGGGRPSKAQRVNEEATTAAEAANAAATANNAGGNGDAGAATEAYADGEGDPCPNCGRVYAVGEFWIACDFCDAWYDGECVAMTPAKAQRMGKWKCPVCLNKQ